MNKFVLGILSVLLLGMTLIVAGNLSATSVVIEGMPGESASGVTLVKNDLGVNLTSIEIQDVRLIGEIDKTQKITRDMITVTPQEFELDNGEQKFVTIKVDIPKELKAQIYSGVFRVISGDHNVPFDVKVVVKEKVEEPKKPFEFKQIEVDGVDVLGTTQNIHVERESVVEIRAEFMSNINSDRVKVKVWIGGFEFGDVSDKTGVFTVEPGIVYSKTLRLEVPKDIE